MSRSRATHRFSNPENGPFACSPSVMESPRQTRLQLADSRLDNPANQGVSDLDCCAEICATADGGWPELIRSVALARVAGASPAAPAAPAPARKWR
jgi:hypothetical protein